MYAARTLLASTVVLSLLATSSGCGWFGVFGGTKTLGCGDFGDDIELEHDPANEVDYIIDCLVEADGIDLVFGEGVVVEFAEGAGLKLGPSLRLEVVANVVDAPTIVLRGTEREPGHWKGIRIENRSMGDATFTNVEISDAGDPQDPDFPGAITVMGQISLGSTRISQIKGIGLWVDEGGHLAGFGDVSIDGCSSYPLRVAANGMGRVDRDNSFSNNNPNRVLVAPGVIETDIVEDPGIPFEISGDLDITGSLNLDDNVTWLMADDARINVTGGLSTDNDALVTISALNEVKGAWQGLWINVDNWPPEMPLKLDNIMVEYGGGGDLFPANVSIERGRVDVQDAYIQHSESCGIRYNQSTVEYRDLGGNHFADNSGGDVCPQ